jgi:hypothetical protein
MLGGSEAHTDKNSTFSGTDSVDPDGTAAGPVK